MWLRADAQRPGRVVLLALLGYSLIRLVTDGFLADAPTLGGIRTSQLVALVVALVVVLLLARGGRVTTEIVENSSTAGEDKLVVSEQE